MKFLSHNKLWIHLTQVLMVSILFFQSLGHSITESSSSSFDIDSSILKRRENDSDISTEKPMLPTNEEEMRDFRMQKYHRMKERRELARERMKEIIQNPQNYVSEKAELMSEKQIDALREEIMQHDPSLEQEENRWLRKRNRNRNNVNPYQGDSLANPGDYYSGWAQAYRMLGGYISCDNRNFNNNNNKDDQGCSRWMLWAAYVDPNYTGNGRSEYFGQSYYQNTKNKNRNGNFNYYEPQGKLDCHSVDTDWRLMGVYREEFYEFFEQISKHLWYINSYEYTVAIAGLEYLQDGECKLGGYSNSGGEVYSAPKPMEGGSIQMSLYKDSLCLNPYDSDELNYDEFMYGNYRSFDDYRTDDYYKGSQAEMMTKEYTMTLFNEVYEEFKYCTLCLDYPSYQDGYFIGDTGTDEGDLINQCWKFYSHDSYHCNNDCIASAHAQGTITTLKYGDKFFGGAWQGTSRKNNYKNSKYSKNYSSRQSLSSGPSMEEKIKADFFFMFNVVFLCLAYLAYQNVGVLREIVGVDDVEKGGLQHYKERKKRKSKKKQEAMIPKESQSTGKSHGNNNDPSWVQKFKRALITNEEVMNHERAKAKPYHSLLDSQKTMIEKLEPTQNAVKISVASTKTEYQNMNAMSNISNNRLNKIKLNGGGDAKDRKRNINKGYDPPSIKKSGNSKNKNNTLTVSEVIEKHKKSFHAQKQSTFVDNRGGNTNRGEACVVKLDKPQLDEPKALITITKD